MPISTPDVPSTTASRKLGLGRVIDDRFRITGLIGEGMLARVFKAEDLQDGNRVVALKAPHDHIQIGPHLLARFQAEEDMGTSLNHPGILKYLRVPNKSRPYLVMEFLEGETFYLYLKQHGVLPEAEGLAIASQLCDALGHLHERGIIHRDLKPENVMVCKDGSLRVMDFGIALYPGSRHVDLMGFAPGTPHYMAPERVLREGGDGRTDLYSLGAMLYHMLTGVIAFENPDISFIMRARATGDPEAPRKLNPKISEEAEEIILHAMERDPDKRYPNAAAMKVELDHSENVTLTGRWRRLEPSTRWRRAKLRLKPVIGWAVIPVVLQVVLFFWLWHHLNRHK